VGGFPLIILRRVMNPAPVQVDASLLGSPRTGIGQWKTWTWLWSIAAALLLRGALLNFESGDYQLFLSRWYDFFVEHGRWRGLGELDEQFASYPPLYMYLISLGTLFPLPKLYTIKLISGTVDFVGAWYVWRLLRRVSSSDRKPWAAATAFLLLPTVVMNSALWGQCDVMYTCGFLASLFYLLDLIQA
jgi:Gpi18-like mannosyltransferase